MSIEPSRNQKDIGLYPPGTLNIQAQDTTPFAVSRTVAHSWPNDPDNLGNSHPQALGPTFQASRHVSPAHGRK